MTEFMRYRTTAVDVENGIITMEADPVTIREFNPFIKGEENFLLSTWMRDLRDADPSGLPDDLWYSAHRLHIKNTLADRNAVVLIAAASDEPTEILGYVVGIKGSHLEWIFVRPGNIRNQGLARRLLEAAGMHPQLPCRFQTKAGRAKILNPFRSRMLRQKSRPSRPTSTPPK